MEDKQSITPAIAIDTSV